MSERLQTVAAEDAEDKRRETTGDRSRPRSEERVCCQETNGFGACRFFVFSKN